ncbi:glycerophosphodiester phosphodiesterase [Shewanella mangrovi]|uniref:Glycerophosphodiester phosphodiesterase n=1 Tax=Shewanella mangrovi TaxID=1515746 RepID=A0A094JU65_9GAMM|nr:glycerophosphodiester phosphodiesterase [Shewanella mangrovi]KFZ36016.1 glycerophosphodiester phosphodiesterase [Shewanella mangrovi]
MLVIAHRGASGHCPENTLSAMEYALSLGAEAIELDVHCVEGELYVFHDRRLEYKSCGQGLIDQRSQNELSQITVLGEAIPTLWQVLQLVAGRAMVNIELKGVNTLAPLIAAYPRYLSELGFSAEQLLISSFNHRYLLQLRQALPHARIGVLFSGIPLDYDTTINAIQPYSLHLDINFISLDMLKCAQQLGIKTYAYTVDYIDDMHYLQQLGVDGIFCNFPDRAMHALAEPASADIPAANWFD